GFVVVKALGGDEVNLAKGTRIILSEGKIPEAEPAKGHSGQTVFRFPQDCRVHYTAGAVTSRSESFLIGVPRDTPLSVDEQHAVSLPAGAQELVPGSSWGTFTIACTIPIGLFMGLWMYRIRRGRIGEATVIGVVAVLAAVIVGNWIPGSPFERLFQFSKDETILALTTYG